jgi:cytochrome c oxidase assembly protein subunit 15
MALVGTLLMVGAFLALLPVAWVLKRNATAVGRYHALVIFTLFLTFDLVVFGAFTRLSDSGLGCPDWPGCYGESNPQLAHDDINVAQAAMPSGPVTHAKAWIEMIHRYLATGVGALITTLLVYHAWLRRQAVPVVAASWLPFVTLLWVLMQGAFGALTVTMKLFPLIVTLHLLGGMGLLGLLAAQTRSGAAVPLLRPQFQPFIRRLVRVGLAAVIMQVALGGWVSANYAVLACDTVPLCQGQVWPLMDWQAGFSLWRELGQRAQGGALPFEALTAIHMAHRLFALGVVAILVWVTHRLYAAGQRTSASWLGILTFAQVLTGLSNVIFGWPMAAALLHTGGAGAMVMVLSATLAGTLAKDRAQ